MATYQIPKMRIDVEINILSSPPLKGAVFISENLLSYTGQPRLEDFLNQEDDRFFPFLHEDGAYRLINKKQVLYMKSSEKNQPEEALLPEPLKVSVHFANGDLVEGVVYTDMPKDAMRVSDFLNQKDTFLPMYSEEQKIIMNTDQILYIKD